MIKYYKSCKVCTIIIKEGRDKSPLLKRIYDSRKFVPNGEALTEILADYDAPDTGDLKILSLYNHCSKHQSLTEAEISEKTINNLEAGVQDARVEAMTTKLVRERLLEIGMKKATAGELKGWTVSAVGKLAKDADDVEAKAKDQKIKVLGMIEGFQSGVVKLPGAVAQVIDLEPADYSVLEA